LSYKARLEDAGLTLESLKDLYEASKSFGGYEGLIKLARAYASLQSIEAEFERARGGEVEDRGRGEEAQEGERGLGKGGSRI